MNLSKIAGNIIEYSFYLLIFLVPIIWLPVNSELFELNKITVTYILAAVILGAWITKAVSEQNLSIKKTPLDIFLALFLLVSILSTIFSMDWHISLFGYYGRFNGGLISTITYIFLYYALVTHFDKTKIIRLLTIGFATSVVVAIYANLQHPNPIFRAEDGSFRGIDAGYWDINAENRAFSFIGQPNWLAAYLSIFFFVGVSFLINVKKGWQKFLLLISLSIIFLGFNFAYSRGGTLGFAAGFLVFSLFLFVRKPTLWEKIKTKLGIIQKSMRTPSLEKTWLWLSALLVVIVLVNFFFSNAFTKRGIDLYLESPNITQLEIEGEGTSQIRFIVWKGSIDIFKNNPILGTGVETFALSYYQHRPPEHNQTREWDFLYNKAHNEYINYLATTGILGTVTYLLIIIAFSLIMIRWLYDNPDSGDRFLMIGVFAGYVSYLIQNIFGFSVVIISILFFLIPGSFFILKDEDKLKERVLLSKKFFRFTKSDTSKIITFGLTLILTLSLVISVINFWVADYYFAKGLGGSTGTEVINSLQNAVRLRPDEPLYLSELAAAEAGISAQVDDKDFSKELAEDAEKHIEQSLRISPNNLGIWRNKLRVYYELSKVNEKYLPETLKTAEKTAMLAPTDAKLHYNLALFYLLDETKEGINKSNEVLVKVLDWRPEYLEARRQLAKNYVEQGKSKKAKEHLEFILKEHPEDLDSIEILESLK